MEANLRQELSMFFLQSSWIKSIWKISTFLIIAGVMCTLNVAHAAAKPKVVLLLHGMASDLTKWNKLVDNSSGFDGRCYNPRSANFKKSKLSRNSDGVYCMRFNFGGRDRISSAPKGLGNATCSRAGGCSGDYSTFDSLAVEIRNVVSIIKKKLGSEVEIVLLGHSRGGLAARAFLQSDSEARSNVVGLITTGTPHSGSPLGRYYAYLQNNCLPESKYSAIGIGDCADDWRFTNSFIKEIGGLDLKAPTIDYLSDASAVIKEMNKNVGDLPSIKYTQLAYRNIEFGCMGGSIFNSQSDCGYDIFSVPIGPSDAGLNTVLNGKPRSSYAGDGIVPVLSQKMNRIKGWGRNIKSYDYFLRIHTVEPEQILDISRALSNMYKRVGWRS
jgi:hypothetical protein